MFDQDYFSLDINEVILEPQEIQTAIMHEDVQSISSEQSLICERQIAKAMWVIAQQLELAHDRIIADMGQEPLWSLKDLAIYCRDQIEAKGLKRPSKV